MTVRKSTDCELPSAPGEPLDDCMTGGFSTCALGEAFVWKVWNIRLARSPPAALSSCESFCACVAKQEHTRSRAIDVIITFHEKLENKTFSTPGKLTRN